MLILCLHDTALAHLLLFYVSEQNLWMAKEYN